MGLLKHLQQDSRAAILGDGEGLRSQGRTSPSSLLLDATGVLEVSDKTASRRTFEEAKKLLLTEDLGGWRGSTADQMSPSFILLPARETDIYKIYINVADTP